jgi:hypothetical protein
VALWRYGGVKAWRYGGATEGQERFVVVAAEPVFAAAAEPVAAWSPSRTCRTREVGVTVVRLALSKAEAAEALGVSVDHFERHIQQDLKVVYCGARRLYPIRELERWLDSRAEKVLPVVATNGRGFPCNQAGAGQLRASRDLAKQHGDECDCVRCTGFPKGHALSTTHSAYATLALGPRVEELAAAVREHVPAYSRRGATAVEKRNVPRIPGGTGNWVTSL